MKIALFGDSFGYQKSNEPYPSWVDLLAVHCDLDNHCECGVSEYKILQQIKSADLKQYDKIIVTHTSYSRVYVEQNPLHLDSQYHKNCDVLYADIEHRDDEFSRACKLYFKYIFNDTHAKDIHNLILQQINFLSKNRPSLHLTHFDHTGLFEFDNFLNFHKLFLNNRGPVNHYNESGNQQVYNHVWQKLDPGTKHDKQSK